MARRTIAIVVVTALLGAVYSASVTNRLMGDDYPQAVAAVGEYRDFLTPVSPYRLYSFNPHNARGVNYPDRGDAVWFMSHEVKYDFFRPATSLVLTFLYRVMGDNAWLIQASLMLVGVLLLFLVSRIGTVVTGDSFWGAVVAAVFCVSLGFVTDINWIAAANHLLAATAVLAGIYAWLRTDGSWKSSIVGILLFSCGLAFSESALCALPYFIAASVFWGGAGKTRSDRFVQLGGLGVVIVIWSCVYMLGGFGVAGNEVYANPLSNAANYLKHLPSKLAVASGALFGGIPSEAWISPVFRPIATKINGGLFLVVFVVGLLIARRDREVRRKLLMLYGATIVALLPICAAIPGSRTLLIANLGSSLILALLLKKLFERPIEDGVAQRKALRKSALVGGVLFSIYIVIVVGGGAFKQISNMKRFGGLSADFALALTQAGVSSRDHVIIAATPDYYFGTAFMPSVLRWFDKPIPEKMQYLCVGLGRCKVKRVDERSLEFDMDGGFLNEPSSKLVSGAAPSYVGQKTRIGQVTYEVLAVTADQRPLRVSAVWPNRQLLERSKVLSWKDDRTYVNISMPKIGDTVDFPAYQDPWL